jgi:hypothetical protein
MSIFTSNFNPEISLMKQENDQLTISKETARPERQRELILDASKVDNAVLKRLIEEIKVDKDNRLNAYNRTHNRHNRGR